MVFLGISLYNNPFENFHSLTFMNESINIVSLILDASLVVKAVMGILVFLSLLGWVLILRLSARIGGTMRDDDQFEDWFWSGESLTNIYNQLAHDDEKSGLGQIFCIGFAEYQRLQPFNLSKTDINEAVERKFRIGLGRQQAYTESGLATLASIGSVSPYVGLFGTVWGIMTAFIGLSGAESMSLATVAPGIAEALIATALGLFAAIPASLGFNHFTAKSANLYESRSLFCDELVGAIESQYFQQNRL